MAKHIYSEQSGARRSDAETAQSSAPGQLLRARTVGDVIRILQVQPPTGFTYRAGQHTKLGLPGGPSRSYTLASAPHEGHLEFCVERVPGGRVSTGLFIAAPGSGLQVGDRAKGSFNWGSQADVHLMVATVTGIAPFRSLILDAIHRGELPGRCVVLHGASHSEQLVYGEELAALAQRYPEQLSYRATVSRPEAPQNRGWSGAVGRVDGLAAAVAAELNQQGGRIQVYACGNPGMISQVVASMEALDLPVATESFG